MPPTADPRLRKLGRRVRALRQEVGLSQEALADEAEVDRTYMSKIERGLANPSYTVLLRLAVALRAHPGRLFDE